jgi:peroxiredoxin
MINYLKDFIPQSTKQALAYTAKGILKQITLSLSLLLLSLTSHAATLSLGDKAPNFKAVTIDGKPVDLANFAGKKPIYLKFWATWCSYCKVEMPHLQAIYDENKNHVEVLTINVGMNDSITNIENFFQSKGFNIPTVFDQKGAITSSYGVVGTPFHVLIDKEGNVAYQTFLATDKLDEKIAEFSQQANKVNKPTTSRSAQLLSHTITIENQADELISKGVTK